MLSIKFRKSFHGALLLVCCVHRAALAAEVPSVPVSFAGAKRPADGAGAATELTAESVAAKRLALKKAIADTRAELAKLPAGSADDEARWLTQETALLERLDAIYAEQ